MSEIPGTFTITIDLDNKPIEKKNYIEELLKLHSCQQVQEILTSQELSSDEQNDAHMFWTVRGHRVREKINDDIRLEAILRKILPPYNGGKVILYRGENRERYNNKHIGFCWTTSLEVAEMFARGLNSVKLGGVVLQHEFDPTQIITGPSRHSIHIREHELTVAPSSIDFEKIVILQSHPPTL